MYLTFVYFFLIKMAKIKQYLCWLLLMPGFFTPPATAQKDCKLVIHPVDTSMGVIAGLQIPSSFLTKAKCRTFVQQLPSLLMTKGYLSASVDSIWEDSSSVHLLLFTGKKYVWGRLDIDSNDWPLLNQLGYYNSSFNSKFFDEQKVNFLYHQLLSYFSNNGYPFARIYLDSILLTENLISAKLKIDKGTLYHIDTIRIRGDIKISKSFISHYLDINEDAIYQQDKIDKINRQLSQLSFLEQTQPYEVSMLNTGAEINLYLGNKRSNQVNLLIGFLPSNAQTGGKLLLTGEANIDLRNPFGNSEVFALNWKQLQTKSPRLNLLFQRPYIFHSPFGFNMNFQLYKRDSFYLNIQSQAGLSYFVSSKKSITASAQLNKTNVLNVDTVLIKITKRLPEIIDLSSSILSIQYDVNNTNYRFNPRSGNELQFSAGFGNKKVRRNNTILAIKDTLFNYGNLYDTLQQNGYVFRSRLYAAHYFPMAKQATFKTSLNAGWYQSPNYFQNELFQIGGFKLLRGFDEESIFSNRFAVGTLEYRYLLAQNGYFFVFTDIGRAAYSRSSGSYAYTYIGVGSGIAFETKTGIFNISYAVGKRNDLKWDLRQSKIHVGFVSLF